MDLNTLSAEKCIAQINDVFEAGEVKDTGAAMTFVVADAAQVDQFAACLQSLGKKIVIGDVSLNGDGLVAFAEALPGQADSGVAVFTGYEAFTERVAACYHMKEASIMEKAKGWVLINVMTEDSAKKFKPNLAGAMYQVEPIA